MAQPEKPLDLLIAVWPLMVGKRLASHTRPVAWHKGRVEVAVDEPEWHSQLSSMAKDVRKQVNGWWGAELVREVRFVAEPSRHAAARSKRPSAAAEKETAKGAAAENKVSAVLKDLGPSLERIADTDLRDLIGRVAGQYLKRQGKK